MKITRRIPVVVTGLVLGLGLVSIGYASVINVPADYSKIEDAINAAGSGDTVLVAPGTYGESIQMKPGVTIQGSGAELTTIAGNQSYAVRGANDSSISGFTISGSGSGVYCYYSSPTITNNTITANSADGIYSYYSSSIITGNTITANNRNGIYAYRSPLTVTDNTISNNDNYGLNCQHSPSPTISNNNIKDNYYWGIYGFYFYSPITNNTITGNGSVGITLSRSSPTITNNIIIDDGIIGIYCHRSSGAITNNSISSNQEGIRCWYSSPTITNNVITGNSAYGIYSTWRSAPVISYSDIWGSAINYYGCLAGPGDISADPLFVNPLAGDYHLRSQSPCIDAGDNTAPSLPEIDFDGNTRIIDGDSDNIPVVDMGAFEYIRLNSPPAAEANGPYAGEVDDISGASLKVTPQTLNIISKGKHVTAHFERGPAVTGGVELDGSGSTDPDEDTLTYSWDIAGYGTSEDASGVNPTVHLEAGTYEVTLTVSDGEFSDSDTTTIEMSSAFDSLVGMDPEIRCNGVDAEFAKLDEEGDLAVKFDRAEVSSTLSVGPNRLMILEGAIGGEDLIDVIAGGRGGSKGKSKPLFK